MTQLNLHCPICGQVDMVQKVSVIAQGDVTHVHGEYGTHTYPTNLAKSLARPNEPTRSTSASTGGFIFGLLFLMLGAATLAGGKSSGSSLSFFFLALGVLLCIIGFSADARDHKEYRDKLARWPRATEKWNQLYYCRRDDTIFNPYDSESVSMPVSNMTEYLFSDSPHS